MDVRCERCRAQYVFDDEQVTPTGLTVQCTNCGHVFKVKKKELVVTVPVKPDEIVGVPLPATAVAPRAGGAPPPAHGEGREPAREWRVRQANGNTFAFRELTTLQKWIIEQKVSRDDEISLSGEQWKRLGNIADLAGFFQVVEAAERARSLAVPGVTPLPVQVVPAHGVPLQPPLPAAPPPPGLAPAPSPSYPRGEAAPGPAEPGPTVEVDLGDVGAAAVAERRSGRRGAVLAAVLLLGAAAAAGWAYAPRLLEGKAPEPVAVPLTIEVKPAEPPPPEPAATQPPEAAPPVVPVAAPEAVAEVVAPPPPAPVPSPAPTAPPVPRGPKALLAQAAWLRDRGDVERALDLYGRVANDDPDNAEALTGRGLCYLDLETYPPAEASFAAALRAAPDQPDALLGLAETYRWQGKRTDAIRYYERYLAAHPAGEEAAVARNALEQLRN